MSDAGTSRPDYRLDVEAIAGACPSNPDDTAGWASVGRHVPALVDAVRQLRRANERLNAELPHPRSASSDSEFTITVRPGQELMVALADQMAQVLAADPAHDYVEWDLKPAGQILPYRLILVRPGGRSPHELRQAADAIVHRVRQLLADPDVVLEMMPTGDATASPIRAVAVASVLRALDAPEPSGNR